MSAPGRIYAHQLTCVSAKVAAHLFASTSGTDSDWIVKLIDEYPENDEKLPGYELMIDNEVFRTAASATASKNLEAKEPGKVYEYPIRSFIPRITRSAVALGSSCKSRAPGSR